MPRASHFAIGQTIRYRHYLSSTGTGTILRFLDRGRIILVRDDYTDRTVYVTGADIVAYASQ